MLSRFAVIRSQAATKFLIPMFQPTTAVHISAPLSEAEVAKKDNVIKKEFPPPTSKRDFVNYPRLEVMDSRPPVRFGFIPDSWFTFFYPKTGYTGPYMFMITVGSYLFSKEKIIVDHNFMHGVSLIIALVILNKKVGPIVKKIFLDYQEKEVKKLDDLQESQHTHILSRINYLESNENVKKGLVEAINAKKEFVHLQMEATYRERIVETYKTMKKQLDCMAELESSTKRNIHKNLVDYVIRNVYKSITPELEKNAMQNCITELNALAAKV